MRGWILQRISAVLLLFFLTLHMVVVHYPPYHIDFNQVLLRLGDPLWKAVDIAFLGVVLFHALNGTYAVITDMSGVQRYRKALAWAGLIIGLAFFVYGTQTILAFQPGA